VISLQVPALLTYRDVAMRVVSAACKIFAADSKRLEPREFQEQVVSAVGEAFNNTVLHAYRGRSDGRVTIEVEPNGDAAVPIPELEELPESGMGLFIIRSFMDEVVYRSGPPNVLSLRKCL
jgi:serine/threonine-protein kinase RsbW